MTTAEHYICITVERFQNPNWNKDEEDNDCSYSGYEGFVVTTNRQRIYLGISRSRQCCEVTGYFMTEDSLNDFIGAKLLTVSVSDTALTTRTLEEVPPLDHGGVMFVTLSTTEGDLQFVCYNVHNGYYGHDALVFSTQVKDSRYL